MPTYFRIEDIDGTVIEMNDTLDDRNRTITITCGKRGTEATVLLGAQGLQVIERVCREQREEIAGKE
jgi:hypothetical protein